MHLTSLIRYCLHLHALAFTYTQLPSPRGMFLHLYVLFSTQNQLPSIICTCLLSYAITFIYTHFSRTDIHSYALLFTRTLIPSLICTYLHSYTITFTYAHLSSLIRTYLYMHALTFSILCNVFEGEKTYSR